MDITKVELRTTNDSNKNNDNNNSGKVESKEERNKIK
jgi:hypothetical protein